MIFAILKPEISYSPSAAQRLSFPPSPLAKSDLTLHTPMPASEACGALNLLVYQVNHIYQDCANPFVQPGCVVKSEFCQLLI